MKIIPLGDNVLVELAVKTETKGGILLPNGSEEVQSGVIVAIGMGVPSSFIQIPPTISGITGTPGVLLTVNGRPVEQTENPNSTNPNDPGWTCQTQYSSDGNVSASGGMSYTTFNNDAIRNSRGIKIGDKVFLPKGVKGGDVFSNDGKTYLNIKYSYITAIVEE